MTGDHEALLPHGRQFALTWGVSTEFGGMTSAMLRRSRAFATLASSPVDVLTFDVRDDYATVNAVLRGDGRLIDGVRLRNFWDELTETTELPSLRGAKKKALEGFSPLPGDGRTLRRTDSAGAVLQIDRHRADGSLALSDRRDVDQPGRAGGRSLVLCNADGQPVVGFTGARAAYRAWLDLVVGDHDSFFIVDSKTAAPIVAGYSNPRVARIHLLHSSHLAGEHRPWDVVKASRREALAQIAGFDAIVALSERQRDDLDTMFSLGDRLEVVPNSTGLPSAAPRLDRDPRAGVVVGSVDERKRVDHAVEALGRARAVGSEAVLDVYGDGPSVPRLVDAIGSNGLQSAVTIHGFDAGAAEHFAEASFFTLTSTTEGFPLVLAEGMARGCIPLAYDIPYGPADIVADGETGFLLAPGDVAGLSDRMRSIAAASAEELAPMREAAARAAAAFSDESIVGLWAGVFERARDRVPPAGKKHKVEIVGATVRRGREVEVDLRLRGVDVSPAEVSAAIAIHGVDAPVELRIIGAVRRTLRHGVWRVRAPLPSDASELLVGTRIAAHLESTVGAKTVRTPFSVES
ncbi:glycosyltransferase [Amnibacterium flavum]|uniref:Glycosyl transferase family 1 domain-containing protein n=1 Tax=Amnibacterium flavum TaxID=2173173 RepID=A0A2V1HSQ9_9MICO|nr:glycosyltransferase [Amnibacterium flavum]PVZ95623.1 hypothetical protein DDQ50_03820 [Amnibacterium flavum]